MSFSLSQKIILGLTVIPIFIFYWVVLYMGVDVPFQDDFDALLEPTTMLRRSGLSLVEFWQIIYKQDDERRIVVDRLVAFGVDKVLGYLDLRFMIILGASTLLAYTALLWKFFSRAGLSLLFFMPIPWLIFNVQFYDAIFWSMIPMQHVAVFVWGFISIWFLTRKGGTAILLALTFAVFSIYSDVSGNFLYPVGILLLAIQKRWRSVGVWLFVIGLIVFLYFHNLEVPPFRPSLSDNLAKPLNILKTILALPGLWADPGPSFSFALRSGITMVLGSILIVLLIVLAYRKLIQIWVKKDIPAPTELFVWGGLCFLAITFATLALARSSYGLDSVFNTRYRHMYIHWLIMCYLLVLLSFPKLSRYRRFGWAMSAFAVAFCINAYSQYWIETDYFRKVILTDAYEWKNNRALPSTPIYQTPRIKKVVDDIYEKAYEAGVYRGVNYPFANLVNAKMRGETKIDITSDNESLMVYVPNIQRGVLKDDGVYVLLKSGSEIHILPTKNQRRSLRQMLVSGSYYYPGAKSGIISKVFLKSSSLTVEIGVISGEQMYRLSTGQQVNL